MLGRELSDPDAQMPLYIAFLAQEAAIEEADATSEEFEARVQHLAKGIMDELQEEAMAESSTDEIETRVKQVISEM